MPLRKGRQLFITTRFSPSERNAAANLHSILKKNMEGLFLPDTKNKESAERKGFFFRRSKSAPINEQQNSESTVLNETGLYGKVDIAAELSEAVNAAVSAVAAAASSSEDSAPAKPQPKNGNGNRRRKPQPKKEADLSQGSAAKPNVQGPAGKANAPKQGSGKPGEAAVAPKQGSGKPGEAAVAPKQNGARPNGGAQNQQRRNNNKNGTPDASAVLETTSAEAAKKSRSRSRGGARQDKTPLKIIPLGGLGEIGKNMTLFEYKNDIVIVDCGLAFPDDDMPGIDLVIPDFSYVIKNRDKIRGVVLTHGHEDHIGSLSYLLKEVNVPVYSARLTIGLVEGKLKEAGILNSAKLVVKRPGDVVKMGGISVEFIAVNHSIPDACGFAITTPVGTIIHTGDFKIDYTPVDGQMIDLARFGELGRHGVLALMSDSTNAERPGMTPSERRVGDSFEMLFKKAGDRRILVASFSSNVHRIQQVIDTAVRHGRKVVVSGRSMENVTAKAMELGYLKAPPDTVIDIDHMRGVPDENLVIITTGSQGEPMSALTRMARGEHRRISVTAHDFIIISATPIPGNEKLVGKVINDLMTLGAEVIYESSMGIHVSGHACREEIRTILGLTKPKFFLPVHGEYKHLIKNRELAMEMGIPDKNILVGEIGRVIELTPDSVRAVSTVPSGSVMVDGSGIGDVGSIVLRDRKLLAEDGLIIAVAAIDSATGDILSGPDVVSRGFVYVRESEELLAGARQVCRQALASCAASTQGAREWSNLKQAVRDQLGGYLFNKTKRRPMILPIIQEIQTKEK